MHVLWANSARRDASKRNRFLVGMVCCLLANVGCNSGRQLQTDLYQRELRLQEDEIYRLEDCLEEYQAIVRDYRCELTELKRDGASRAVEPTAPTIAPLPEPINTPEPNVLPEVPEPLDLGPPATTDDLDAAPPVNLDEAPAFNGEAPDFNAGGEAPPFEGAHLDHDRNGGSVALASEPSGETNLTTASASRSLNGDGSYAPPNPYPHAAETKPLPEIQIALSDEIELHAEGGSDRTLVARVVVRSSDLLADFDGQASIMLTDPSIEGRLRRVARWDFTSEEVREAWNVGEAASPSAELSLPIALPTETPIHQPLRLWVRLVDSYGNKILQATVVKFVGDPLRLDTPDRVASAPRRLPAIQGPVRHVESFAAVEERQAAVDFSTEAAWRPAATHRRRHRDPAIQTASFEDAGNEAW